MKKVLRAMYNGCHLSSRKIVDKIFQDRNIVKIYDFIYPTEDSLLPYTALKNIEEAFQIVDDGITNDKSYLIIADTDIDGCTAGAVMYKYLKQHTDKVNIYINEGKKHGISDFAAGDFDSDIIIIVDSIDRSECYDRFKGRKVIILDHHIIPDNFCADVTLVSSANDYPNPQLSGAGVVWKFCKYCDEMYLTDYADELTDLAACGIIADMCDVSVPENRYICFSGFNNLHNKGIKKVVGGYKFNSQAVSFSIAPLVNAANRLNRNELALNLFLLNDDKEIKDVVKQLKQLKEKQNGIVSNLLPMCQEQAKTQTNDKVMIFIPNNQSNTSLSGLMANKFADMYKRPVLVLNDEGDKYCGSGRGYATENFKEITEKTNLICGGGGHENAFGLKIYKDQFSEFRQRLNSLLVNYDFKIETIADVELPIQQISNELIDLFKKVNFISGEGFPPLMVMITNITNYTVGSMSNGKHLKIMAGDLALIKWNFTGDYNEFDGRPITVIGELNSSFLGRVFTKQLIIRDYEVGL